MAKKRMFSQTITESDAFMDLPLSSQALYFHLSLQCDDDGFTSSSRRVMRMIGANKNDYDVLIAKRFVLEFEDGVVVIKHWLMHNFIRKDRYQPTVFTQEKEMLFIKDNKSYTLDELQGIPLNDIPVVNQRLPSGCQVVDVDKISLDKNSIDKNREDKKKATKELSLLEIALNDFKKMRKTIRSPLTHRAEAMLINKLDKMADTEKEKIAILEQSIFNSWKGVFELKDNPQSKQKPKERELRPDEIDFIPEWKREEMEEDGTLNT